VAANDPHLEQGDVRFEPRSGLIGGGDGLRCIRHIVAHAREYLKPGGWLLFEHGYDQADACCALLQAAAYVDILSRRDLAGIPRLAGGRSWT
ncbi:MAG: protein-(glutamine-N5) methyltransferase, release factor-specific, partial [Pseudomonadota bacterium]|nr:protein-(glutamine-N5) methyltransferase, release factor-specific [Pseudomonadota bacterium]